MKRFFLLFGRCVKQMRFPFVAVFALNIVMFGLSWISIAVFPSMLVTELLGDKSIVTMLVLLGILATSTALSKYAESVLYRQLFCFRLGEISEIQKASLRVPISKIEQGDGKDQILRAMSAVASGNNYGIEAYLCAAIECILVLITLFLYVITIPGVPVWVYGLIIVSNVLLLPYTIRFFQKEESLVDQSITDRNYLEEFRRCILQDTYAKDSRMFDTGDYTRKELNFRTDPVNSFAKNRQKVRITGMWFTQTVCLVKNLVFLGIMAFGFDTLSIGELTLYTGLMTGADALIQKLADQIGAANNNRESVGDYLEFITVPGDQSFSNEIKEPSSIEKIEELSFTNVSFSYGNECIFDSLSFSVRTGERLAVIGKNGVGKTTLIKLVLGVLQPSGGTIQVNTIDVRFLRTEDYWKHISVSLQDSPFFSFTLAENISCEPPDMIDRDRLKYAISRAGLAGVVEKMPEGEDSYCTNEYQAKGVNLSGGERQKMYVARMLYRNAEVLLLDEPTAALDPKAELAIYKLYDKIADDKICLFVSHRLNTTMFCDKILFIEDSHHIYVSNFYDLYATNKKFRELYDTQESYYREEKR